jgi:hypothetical protein
MINKTKCPLKLVKLRAEFIVLEGKISSRHEFRRAKKEKEVIDLIKKEPAVFYKYAKSFSRESGIVGPLVEGDADPVSDKQQVAEVLGRQYSGVFSSPRSEVDSAFVESLSSDSPDPEQCLTDISVTLEDVRVALSSMTTSSAAGPDGIPPICFKKGGVAVMKALLNIFTESLETGEVPVIMKQAWISPIWKGGDRSSPANWRPVALTGHLTKLLERVVRSRIVTFMEENKLFDVSQHGARSGRSTITQLLAQHDRLLSLLEDGGNAEVVYLDFSKAFDLVDHGILLTKLSKMGVRGTLLKWIASFLQGRNQAVRVGSALSSWARVVSGVPQGSVLGPLLFLVFIEDLGLDLDDAQATLLKFVDDSKLIGGSVVESDVEQFQVTLDRVYLWAEANNMRWNGLKFQHLRLGPNSSLKENTLLFSPGMEEVIAPQGQIKDLGVLVDDECSFREHRAAVIRKTRQKAGWVLRTFKCRDLNFMKTLWRSVIQPHQDYCSQLWSPVGRQCDLEAQEGPLRAFSKRTNGLHELCYWDRLQLLGVSSVERRSERYKILYTWKMLQNLVPNIGVYPSTREAGRRGQTLKIPALRGSRAAVRSLRDVSITTFGPRLINALPEHLRNFEGSLESFKKQLDSVLCKIPDQPNVGGFAAGARDAIGRPSNSVCDWLREPALQSLMLPPRGDGSLA